MIAKGMERSWQLGTQCYWNNTQNLPHYRNAISEGMCQQGGNGQHKFDMNGGMTDFL